MEKFCEDIEQMLVDYADGQLSPSDSSKVAKHLAKCEHCRKKLYGLQKSLELAGVIWTDAHTETKAGNQNILKAGSRKCNCRRGA